MKNALFAAIVMLGGMFNANAQAAGTKSETKTETKVNEINCEAIHDYAQINITLSTVTFAQDSAIARHYSATMILDQGLEYGVIPKKSGGSTDGKDLKSTPYKGRTYKNHVKFELATSSQNWSGDFIPEAADLIISPEFKVEKTIHEENDWDKTWTWDVEVRKHSAVLATHFDDHHGDYIPLNCYSLAHVNDSKGRQ